MPRIKAIIFDCFGVLVTDALEEYLRQLDPSQANLRSKVAGIVDRANRGLITRDVSRREVSNVLGMSVDQYAHMIQTGEIRNHELLTYITQLRKTHKTALLSNISRASLNRRFSQEELARYFDVQLVSGELGMAKPDVAIYQLALKELGTLPNETVFIDDRADYLAPAAQLGVHTILFTENDDVKLQIEGLIRD